MPSNTSLSRLPASPRPRAATASPRAMKALKGQADLGTRGTPSKDSLTLSDQARTLLSGNQGTEGPDEFKPSGTLPKRLDSFGGDDHIWMTGSGDSQVFSGSGNDIVSFSTPASESKPSTLHFDGGEGRDTLFVGDKITNDSRAFHTVDSKGKTVAKRGTNPDKITTDNVEHVHARTQTTGTAGNDQVAIDLGNESETTSLREEHTVFTRDGDDQISVKTNDSGSSETKIWPGRGNNQVQFTGGEGHDDVTYISEREKDGSKKGGDQVSFRGGGGSDHLRINSQNYTLTNGKGTVLSKMGEGADKISVDDFSSIRVNEQTIMEYGQLLKRDKS